MTTKMIYIFGIIPNIYGADMFRSIENSGVYTITYQNISAIVCDWESTLLAFSDRESLAHLLAHHQKTLEGIMDKGFKMRIIFNPCI